MASPEIAAVAAIGKNRVLGRGNRLLWHIPDDLKRFKELTTGHPIIMGRKTFESILGYLGTPLPNRTNIVVTRDPSDFLKNHQGVTLMADVIASASVEAAIERGTALDRERVTIGGGAQIYELALPYTTKLYLTLIDAEADGDAYFPAYEDTFTKSVFEEEREWNGLKYRWVDLEK